MSQASNLESYVSPQAAIEPLIGLAEAARPRLTPRQETPRA
jgi:hypothetical protein